jgi:hypothetical protein
LKDLINHLIKELEKYWLRGLNHHKEGNYVNLHNSSHWAGILTYWEIKKYLDNLLEKKEKKEEEWEEAIALQEFDRRWNEGYYDNPYGE